MLNYKKILQDHGNTTRNEFMKLLQYRCVLLALHERVEKMDQKLFRCDLQFVPNLIGAIESLANDQPFCPVVASSGMSSIKSLPDSPVDVLKVSLVEGSMVEHFQKMICHYEGHDIHAITQLNRFVSEVKKYVTKNAHLLEPSVLLYKAKNGELAVKFSMPEERQRFLDALGGIQFFNRDGGKSCPMIYENNDTTLYFPAYEARNGELAVNFPNIEMREKFMDLMRLRDASMINEMKLVSTYPGQDALYINDRRIHESGSNISLTAKLEQPERRSQLRAK